MVNKYCVDKTTILMYIVTLKRIYIFFPISICTVRKTNKKQILKIRIRIWFMLFVAQRKDTKLTVDRAF